VQRQLDVSMPPFKPFKPSATPFTPTAVPPVVVEKPVEKPKPAPPPPPPPVDKVLEGLKKLGITDEEEVKKVKELLKLLKEIPKDEPITADLFKQVGELQLC